MTVLRRIGSLAAAIPGSGFPHDFQGAVSGDFPFVKVSDIAANPSTLATAANWITDDARRALSAVVAPAGTILFPKIGAAISGNNRTMLTRSAVFDNNVLGLKFLSGSDRFWYYALSVVDMAQLANPGPIPSLGTDAIRNLDLPCPKAREQQQIADFLDDQVARIDDAIRLRHRELATVAEAVESAAREGVLAIHYPHRSPCSLGWADSIPIGWSVVRLALIARMRTGHTPSRSKPEYWVDCTIPWLTTGDVHKFRHDSVESLRTTEMQISELGLQNSSAVLHPAMTVALSRTASPGFSIILEVEGATSQDFVVWRPTPALDARYLLWTLRAMRKYLLGRFATGSTHKTMYFPDLESIEVPIPPINEQLKCIASVRERTAGLLEARAALNHAINLLEERKRALVTACVTGEFDVSTASNRAAEAVIG